MQYYVIASERCLCVCVCWISDPKLGNFSAFFGVCVWVWLCVDVCEWQIRPCIPIRIHTWPMHTERRCMFVIYRYSNAINMYSFHCSSTRNSQQQQPQQQCKCVAKTDNDSSQYHFSTLCSGAFDLSAEYKSRVNCINESLLEQSYNSLISASHFSHSHTRNTLLPSLLLFFFRCGYFCHTSFVRYFSLPFEQVRNVLSQTYRPNAFITFNEYSNTTSFIAIIRKSFVRLTAFQYRSNFGDVRRRTQKTD